MRCTVTLVVIAAGFVASTTYAQPDSKSASKSPSAQSETLKRSLYLVRYGIASDLAATLSQHYQNEPGFRIIPEPNANALLITAAPSVSDELLKLLDQLDRRPRQVMIEVLLAEVPVDEKEGGFNPADLAGPSEQVLAKVEAAARKTKENYSRRFQITAVENQRSLIQVGGSQPTVTGVALRGGAGGGAPQTASVSYREVGTIVVVTPQVGSDGSVMIELKVEDTRLNTPENGIALGGGAIASETGHALFGGRVRVESGKAVLARSVKSVVKDAKTQSIVVVAARASEK